MKKLILLVAIICVSCQEKQNIIPCIEIEKKYDSLIKIIKEKDQAPFYKFYNIISKEKGNSNDSILISEYQKINGGDSLIDLYIWDRIHTINQNITKINVYKIFKGTYLLKPNHNKKYAQATKVVINNDSCYLYKYNDLVVKEKFKLINSSNKYIKGKLRIRNFRIWLDGTIAKQPIIHIDDNGCMDCEQLQFYKIK